MKVVNGVLCLDLQEQVDSEEVKLARERQADSRRARAIRQRAVDENYFSGLDSITGNQIVVTNNACSCGQHKAIQYFQDGKAVSDPMCPTVAYLAKLRQAVREERAVNFVENLPHKRWIEMFGGGIGQR